MSKASKTKKHSNSIFIMIKIRIHLFLNDSKVRHQVFQKLQRAFSIRDNINLFLIHYFHPGSNSFWRRLIHYNELVDIFIANEMIDTL